MNITNKTWVALVLCALCPLAQAADRIAAVVGHQVITQQEWQQRMQQVKRQNPAANLPSDLSQQVLETLIVERSQLQAATDMGIVVSARDIDLAQQRIAAQNGLSVEQLVQRLGQDGLSPAGYRQQLRDQLMIQRAHERVIDERLHISSGDVQAELDRLASVQPGERALELAQILIAVPEQSSAQDRSQREAQANEAARRAQAGEDFTALASEYGATWRSLGLKPEAAYPALFLSAVKDLSVSGVSAVVASGAGFHVLKVLQRVSNPALPNLPQTHARHILRRADDAAQRQAALALLERVRADVLAGRIGFAQAAAKWSEDGSASGGGDLGWTQPGQFVAAFETAMDALAPQTLSQPVETEFGVHLIEVLARREVPMNESQQRNWVRNQLRSARSQQVLQTWVREVRSATYVQIHASQPP